MFLPEVILSYHLLPQKVMRVWSFPSWNWAMQLGVTNHPTPPLVTTQFSSYCGFLLWCRYIMHLHPWTWLAPAGKIPLPTERSGFGVSLYCWSNPLRPLQGGRSWCAPSASICSLFYYVGKIWRLLLGWVEALQMTANNRDHWWMPWAYVPPVITSF